MLKVWALLLLAFALSCRSTKPKSPDEVGLKEVPSATDPEVDSADALPPSLWSPMRRQSNASFHFLVAESEMLSANVTQARQMYESAYNLDPNHFLAWKMVAAQAASGQISEALLQAKKLILLYPGDAELQNLYAQLLASSGLYDQARESFERAIDLNPKRLEPYMGLIQIYQAQKKLTEAVVVAQDLVKIDAGNGDGWALLAKLYLATNQRKKALRPAKMAFELQSADSEKILIYALALELNGQSKQAVNLYELLYRLNPTNEDLIARMVELYRKIGDLNDALAILKEVTEQPGGGNPGVRMQQAFILWELERFQEASVILNDLSERYPESDRLLYMAALGQERLKQWEQALLSYQKVPKTSQYHIHAQYRAVGIFRQLRKTDAALDIVKAVIRSKVDRAGEFYAVGAGIYGDDERYREAVSFLNEGYRDYPDAIQILFLRGVYQEKAQDRPACIETMREVIRKDPNHSSAHNYLGYLFAEAGENLDEAELLIKRALELKPGDGFYLDSLGWVYYQRKEYSKAIDALTKAIAAVPEEAVILEHLGDVYLRIGQKEKAREHWQQAAKAKGEERDLSRIRKKLEQLTAAQS